MFDNIVFTHSQVMNPLLVTADHALPNRLYHSRPPTLQVRTEIKPVKKW